MGIVCISERLSKQLDALAKETKHPKSYYVEKALKDFLDKKERYILALADLENRDLALPWQEAKKLIDQLRGD